MSVQGKQEMSKDGQHVRQYLSVFMIDHDIVWLDISVHNPHTVAVVQSLSGKKGKKKMLDYTLNVKTDGTRAR